MTLIRQFIDGWCICMACGARAALDRPAPHEECSLAQLREEARRLEERCMTYREEREAARDALERELKRSAQVQHRVTELEATVSALQLELNRRP